MSSNRRRTLCLLSVGLIAALAVWLTRALVDGTAATPTTTIIPIQVGRPLFDAIESRQASRIDQFAEDEVDATWQYAESTAPDEVIRGRPLHVALRVADAATVSALLARGVDNKRRETTGKTPLGLAITADEHRRVSLTCALLDGGADPNQTFNGRSPLRAAIEVQDVRLVRLLREQDAQFDRARFSDHGISALHWAAKYGDVAVVKELTEVRWLFHTDREQKSVLHWAIEGGDEDIVAALLAAMRPGKRDDPTGQLEDRLRRLLRRKTMRQITPLELAARVGSLPIVELLLQQEMHLTDCQNGRPINEAAARGHVAVVERLVAAGFDPRCYEPVTEHSAIHLAAAAGHTEIVRLLLGQGIEPTDKQYGYRLIKDFSDRPGYYNLPGTPIYLAAENGHADTLRLLLDKADQLQLPVPIDDLWKAAAKSGNVESMKTLLSFDGSPSRGLDEALRVANAELAEQMLELSATPSDLTLHLAAPFAPPAIIQQLLDLGADPLYRHGISDKKLSGYIGTPLHVAVSHRNIAVIKLLLEQASYSEQSPAVSLGMLAAVHGTAEIVDVLQEHGFDMHSHRADKRAPVVLAAEFGNASSLTALLAGEVDQPTLDTALVRAVHVKEALYADPWPNVESVRLLLDAGANPLGTEPHHEDTALAVACTLELKKMLRQRLSTMLTAESEQPPPDVGAEVASGSLPFNWDDSPPRLRWLSEDVGDGPGLSRRSFSPTHVYLLGSQEYGQRVVLSAVNLTDGTVAWSTDLKGLAPANRIPGVQLRAPTYSDGRVYAFVPERLLVCLNAGDGEVLWQAELGSWDLRGKHSVTASFAPLVDGGKVICRPAGKGAVMTALDAATGDVIWRAKGSIASNAGRRNRNGRDTAFSGNGGFTSAQVVEVGGVRQYLQQMSEGLVSVRASDGQLLWTHSFDRRYVAAFDPVVVGRHVIIGDGDNLARLLELGAHGPEAKPRVIRTVDDHDFGEADAIWYDKGHLYLAVTQSRSSRTEITCVRVDDGQVVWEESTEGRGYPAAIVTDGHLILRHSIDGDVTAMPLRPDGLDILGRFTPPFPAPRNLVSSALDRQQLFFRQGATIAAFQLRAE